MAGDNKKTATFRKAEPADRSLLVAHLLSSPGAVAAWVYLFAGARNPR